MRTVLLLVSAAILLAGCGITPPIEGQSDPYAAKQVHFTDSTLRDSTAINKPILTRDPASGILYVTLPIRAVTNYDLDVDWRITFYDSAGRPIGEPTGWSHLTLAANTPQTLTTNSTGPEAANFQIDFRWAK